ncbi:hypothetical protein E2I00_017062, partial [Balaenoptera physalus]
LKVTGSRNWRAARDTRRYRHHYPDLVEGDGNGDMPNLSFYKNEIRFLPNGVLFPLREPGVNCHAKPLTLQEVEVSSKGQGRGLAGHRGSRARSGAAGGAEPKPRDESGTEGGVRPHNCIGATLSSLLLSGAVFQAFKSSTEHYQAPLARFFLEETLVRRQLPGGDEAGEEQGPESPNPKESKKRKLEANLRERAPGEPGPSASEVEKIALNLEGCALSQGSLGAETQEVGSQAPEEAEQPCPQPLEAKVADEVRKRRKTDQGARDGTGVAAGDGTLTLATTQPPAPSGCPVAEEGENGVKEADGQAGPERGAPGSPATAGPEVDERAERAEPTEAGPSVQPGEP